MYIGLRRFEKVAHIYNTSYAYCNWLIAISSAKILKRLCCRITFSASIIKFAIFAVFRTSAESICALPLLLGEYASESFLQQIPLIKRKPLSTMISLNSFKVSKYPQELVSFLCEIPPIHRSEINTLEEFGATQFKNVHLLWCF